MANSNFGVQQAAKRPARGTAKLLVEAVHVHAAEMIAKSVSRAQTAGLHTPPKRATGPLGDLAASALAMLRE